MFDTASGIILSGSGLVSHDKVGTTPNAELPLVTAQGIEESLTMRTRPPSSQTISSQQSHSRSTRQLSLQIELISHMHIWGTERLRPWIEVSYLSHVSGQAQRRLKLIYSLWGTALVPCMITHGTYGIPIQSTSYRVLEDHSLGYRVHMTHGCLRGIHTPE